MKIGRLFPDLLATLGRASSPEIGVARGIKRLVTLTGASAGRLTFWGGPGLSTLCLSPYFRKAKTRKREIV